MLDIFKKDDKISTTSFEEGESYMKDNNEKIYLTEEGLKELELKIKELESKIRKVSSLRREAFKNFSDTVDNGELFQNDLELRLMNTMLSQLKKDLTRVVLIQRGNDESVIDIGDTVAFSYEGDDEEIEVQVCTLVGNPDPKQIEEGYCQLTLSSPVGKALYGRRVGEKVAYQVKGQEQQIQIIKKVVIGKIR